jgi:predicted DNA-binding antitoxin AbrB/MazE fold protein
MSQRLKAIYENGVLRPLGPLDLPEHSQVEIHVQRLEHSNPPSEHRLQVRHLLIEAGLSLPANDAVPTRSKPLTQERREELSRLFSSGKPLADLIDEDREGR